MKFAIRKVAFLTHDVRNVSLLRKKFFIVTVKSEFRTHCRHHGGECMDKCAMTLQRDAIDCMNQICCVLV